MYLDNFGWTGITSIHHLMHCGIHSNHILNRTSYTIAHQHQIHSRWPSLKKYTWQTGYSREILFLEFFIFQPYRNTLPWIYTGNAGLWNVLEAMKMHAGDKSMQIISFICRSRIPFARTMWLRNFSMPWINLLSRWFWEAPITGKWLLPNLSLMSGRITVMTQDN